MEREQIELMAIEAGGSSMVSALTHPEGPRTAIKFKVDDGSLERFAQLVAAAERERCARLAESIPDDEDDAEHVAMAFDIAFNIRALK